MNSKYSKLLTIILVVAIIIVVILFVFFGIQIYKQYYVEKQQSDMTDIFDNQVTATNVTTTPQTPTNTTTTSNEVVAPVITDNENTTGQGGQSSGGSSSSGGIKYKGYTMVGKIEIPKIKVNYPILAKTSTKAIEIAVSVLYGPGPNKPGVTVVVGHNYKNGTMFSNNKKLEIGDEIYVTDTDGNRVKYIIYDKQILAPEDFGYAQKDTQGAREIALSTCTDDVNSRLVLMAKEG